MRSIERTLLAWIMGTLAVGALLMMVMNYRLTLDEMNEVFDDNLAIVARAVAAHAEAPAEPNPAPSGPGPLASASLPNPSPPNPSPPHASPAGVSTSASLNATSDEPPIVAQTWDQSGRRRYTSNPLVDIPLSGVQGLARVRVGSEDWFVHTVVLSDGIAQAAQSVASRKEMASETAIKTVPGMIALLCIVAALLIYGLRRGLQPLDSAATDVAERSVRSLDPIPTVGVPKEIMPLVGAINDLLSRLAQSFSVQRQFLADAAHELRTPITALRLQLQLLADSRDDTSRDVAMTELRAGVDRSQHLIEQLLQVARTEPDSMPFRKSPVGLDQLVRSVVSTLSAKAADFDIDLGAGAPSGAVVDGDADQLTVLLSNLVENALRYTPAGGTVDAAAFVDAGGQRSLRVIDDGPGIPEAARARVFDRFYRGEDAQSQARDGAGNGLGLAIVQAIAQRHRARVSLATPASGKGLEVIVAFEGSVLLRPAI